MIDVQMDERALNRALLARQLLLERLAIAPREAIERLIGLQSQAPQPPYTGLWSRLEPFDPDIVSQGLLDRSLVRVSTMRGTVHLMSSRDAAGMRPLLQHEYERLLRANAAWPKIAELDLNEVAAFGRDALTAEPRSLKALRLAVSERWPDLDPAAITVAIAGLLPIVQLPPRGLWQQGGNPVLTPLDAWIGVPSEPIAIDQWVRRYLAAFGPASSTDMQTWSGLFDLKPVFERMRPELIVVRVGKRELFDLPEAPRPDSETEAPVRFIAEWDNLLIGHKQRSRIIADEDRRRIATPNGIVPGTILVDGFVNGAWKIVREKTHATLMITLFRPVAAGVRDELEAEGNRLLTFLTPSTESRFVEFTPAE